MDTLKSTSMEKQKTNTKLVIETVLFTILWIATATALYFLVKL
jgi:hypothetical protein